MKMTFLENLEPLLKAAEVFDRAHKAHKANNYGYSTIDDYNQALVRLAEAAVKYCEWGSK